MNVADNPFSPTFGTTPPFMAGRDGVLERFAEAIRVGPTHPDYTILITGDRGTGKTALLNVLEGMVAERGWATIATSAMSQTLADRILTEAQALLASLDRRRRRPQIESFRAMGVDVRLDDAVAPQPPVTFLSALEKVGDLLAEQGLGLLVTVDELHDVGREQVRDVAAAIQIVTRRRLCPVAFAGAALPLIEHTHLADPNMTFLQRCARAPLGPLNKESTIQALREPITQAGGAIEEDALHEAAAATLGFPYMIQLVGFHAWRMREEPDDAISLTNVRAAAMEAEVVMIAQIAGPVWNRLSPMEKRFLVAMLRDEDSSAIEDVAARLGRTRQYVRTYRRRLLAAGAISPTSEGRFRFRHRALRTRARQASRDDHTLSEVRPLRPTTRTSSTSAGEL